MNDLDKKIRDALREEDADLFTDFGGEQSLFELVADVFRGRRRWLVAITALWSFVFFVLSVLAGIKFFYVTETRDMLMYAAGCILGMSAVLFTKTWCFMELHKNTLTREIKRLELQIARLAARIKD